MAFPDRSRSKCPCTLFNTSSKILSSLHSTEKTECLVKWIEGPSLLARDNNENVVPVCEYNPARTTRCLKRVDAAFTILNAIREACRIHLERGDKSEDETPTTQEESLLNVKSEEAFPSLSSSSTSKSVNILTPKKKQKKKVQPVHLANASNKNAVSKMISQNSTDAFPALYSSLSKTVNILTPKKKPKQTIPSMSSANPAKKKSASKLTTQKKNNSNSAKVESFSKIASKQMKPKKRVHPAQIMLTKDNAWGNISNIHDSKPSSSVWPSISTKNETKDKHKHSTIKVIEGDPIQRVMQGIGEKDAFKTTKLNPDTIDEPTNLHIRKSLFSSPIKAMEKAGTVNTLDTIDQTDSAAVSPCQKPLSEATVLEVTRIKCKLTTKEIETLQENTLSAYLSIIYSQLVPSLAIELQLLLRLLTISDEANSANNTRARDDCDETSKSGCLAKLFEDAECCRTFAANAFSKLKDMILNLDRDLLLTFLQIEAFVERLPDLVPEIQGELDKRRFALLSQGKSDGYEAQVGHLISGQSAMITMAFQEERDSRHNYRSRELMRLYNNREECRDTFLSQLRAFQHIKGTVLNHTEIERALDDIKSTLHGMMRVILPSNIPWFGELFTELLLQIGLVPMQELDAEIIKNVANKERLQKLHERFTAKSPQKNKSSKPLVQKNNSSMSREHFFTGHEEFFFLFVHSVDSFKFNHHLQRRLARVLIEFSTDDKSGVGIEQSTNEMMMLSKFLGLLVFSPNYDVNGISDEDFDECFRPLFPIKKVLEDAIVNGKILTIMPWVITFLWMISWDNISKKKEYYTETFSILRRVHNILLSIARRNTDTTSIDLFPLIMQLDNFFAQVVGLSNAEKLCPPTSLHTDRYYNGFDKTEQVYFSRRFVSALSPHLEDLHKLASDLADNKILFSSSSSSKKLNPSSLTTYDSNNFFKSENAASTLFNPIDNGKLQGFLNEHNTVKHHKGNGKLIDAFFHQHKPVQKICDFVIDYAVENIFSKKCYQEIIIPTSRCIVTQTLQDIEIPDRIEIDWYLDILQKIEKQVDITVTEKNISILKEYVTNAIESLACTSIQRDIKRIAISLSVDHALLKITTLSSYMIRTQVKGSMDNFLRNHQRSTDVTLQQNTKCFSSKTKNIIALALQADVIDLEMMDNLNSQFSSLEAKDGHEMWNTTSNKLASRLITKMYDFLVEAMSKAKSMELQKTCTLFITITTTLFSKGLAHDWLDFLRQRIFDTPSFFSTLIQSIPSEHHLRKCLLQVLSVEDLITKKQLLNCLLSLFYEEQLTQETAQKVVDLIDYIKRN